MLIEFASHHFDLWRFVLGSEVEEVFVLGRSDDWDDVTSIITGQMSDGVLVSSVLSQATSEHKEMKICGRAGCLHISLDRFDGLEFQPLGHYPGGIRPRLRHVVHFLREFPYAMLGFGRGGDYRDTYRAEWRHFAEAIRQDTPVGCSLEDGRRALQVALAATESARTGRAVEVAEARRKIISPT